MAIKSNKCVVEKRINLGNLIIGLIIACSILCWASEVEEDHLLQNQVCISNHCLSDRNENYDEIYFIGNRYSNEQEDDLVNSC